MADLDAQDEPMTTTEKSAFSKELEAGVDAVIADRGGASGQGPAAAEPEKKPEGELVDDGAETEGELVDDSGEVVEPGDDESKAGAGDVPDSTVPPEPEVISNACQERAIRAGMSLDQIKQFPNEGLLTAMCDRIEVTGGDTGSPSGAGDQGGEAKPVTMADRLASLPELDPELYDENVIGTFDAMKGMIQQLSDANAELKGAGQDNWLSAKLEGIKDLTSGDADKVSSVKAKFGVLKAGYSAAGQTVTDEKVFEEAASLALGAETAKAGRTRSAARKRSGQRIQRPSGHRAKDNPDARTEIVDKLDRKYFGKR